MRCSVARIKATKKTFSTVPTGPTTRTRTRTHMGYTVSHLLRLVAEDVTDVWATAKLEAIRKVRKMKGEVKGSGTPNLDEKEVEKTFWFSRPDGWVVKKETKRIVMLEFKRASDATET